MPSLDFLIEEEQSRAPDESFDTWPRPRNSFGVTHPQYTLHSISFSAFHMYLDVLNHGLPSSIGFYQIQIRRSFSPPKSVGFGLFKTLCYCYSCPNFRPREGGAILFTNLFCLSVSIGAGLPSILIDSVYLTPTSHPLIAALCVSVRGIHITAQANSGQSVSKQDVYRLPVPISTNHPATILL